jgi:hypothetical protein
MEPERRCVTVQDHSSEGSVAELEDHGLWLVGAPFLLGSPDAERLPFADGAFDAIVCECALCTFPDKRSAVAEFALRSRTRSCRRGFARRHDASPLSRSAGCSRDRRPRSRSAPRVSVRCRLDRLRRQGRGYQVPGLGFGPASW